MGSIPSAFFRGCKHTSVANGEEIKQLTLASAASDAFMNGHSP
jgi:hypothetical protein